MLEGALDLARKTFNTSVVTTPLGEVTDQSQYPLDAFRELIGNALAHRDLYCLVSGLSSRGETSAGPARHH